MAQFNLAKSYGEELFALHCKALSIDVVREYRFHEKRKWRFDFAIPALKIAVEIEGGTWGKSRHTTGSGFEKDCEKYNSATEFGWRVLRYTSKHVKSGEAINQLERMINATEN